MTTKVRHLSFHYPQQTELFRNVQFQVKPGQVVCLLGPNGSGKTTLLKCLGGALTPTHGEVKNSATVAYLPQTTSSLFGYTVLEVVVMGRAPKLSWLQSPSRKDYALAQEALDKVGLTHYTQTSIHELSGGQQQLVFIAQLLVTQAQLLLLDEPTAALDYSNQYRVLYLLKKLSQSQNYALIFTTHHPEQALFLGTHALLLFDDHTNVFGEIDAILTKENLEKLYHMKLPNWSEGGIKHPFTGLMPVF